MVNPIYNREERRPRAGVRLVGQTLLFGVLLLVTVLVVPVAAPEDPAAGPESLAAEGPALVLTALALLASMAVAARHLDRRRLRDFGLRLDRAWWRDCGFGLLLGAVLVTAIFAIQVTAGWLEVSVVTLDPPQLLRFTTGGLVPLVAVGLYEELLSRGYHLTNLAQGLRGWLGARGGIVAALAASSALFGLLHVGNPAATVMSTGVIVLAGLLLGLGYVLTGRLGLPVGLHITWNLFMGPVYGMPVSGLPPGDGALLRTEAVGPDVVTGGPFGPEGGVLGLVGVVVGAAAVLWWARRQEGALCLAEQIAAPPPGR